MKVIRTQSLRFGRDNSRGFFTPRPKQKLFQRWRKRFGRMRSCPTSFGLPLQTCWRAAEPFFLLAVYFISEETWAWLRFFRR